MWWLWNVAYVLLGMLLGMLVGGGIMASRYMVRIGEWLPTHRAWWKSLCEGTCPVCNNSVLHATTTKPHTQWYKCPVCGTVYEGNDFMWLAKLEPET